LSVIMTELVREERPVEMSAIDSLFGTIDDIGEEKGKKKGKGAKCRVGQRLAAEVYEIKAGPDVRFVSIALFTIVTRISCV
jgi:hypothetical protein